MSTTIPEELNPGDRCIVYVNEVNSPTGWWWGLVNEEGNGAIITGPFQFYPDRVVPSSEGWEPLYGDDDRLPTVNYTTYRADKKTMGLVKTILFQKQKHQKEARKLRAQIEVLQNTIKAMVGMTPEMVCDIIEDRIDRSSHE